MGPTSVVPNCNSFIRLHNPGMSALSHICNYMSFCYSANKMQTQERLRHFKADALEKEGPGLVSGEFFSGVQLRSKALVFLTFTNLTGADHILKSILSMCRVLRLVMLFALTRLVLASKLQSGCSPAGCRKEVGAARKEPRSRGAWQE